MVDYNPAVSAASQVLPFEALPSEDTPVTADWLNHVDDVLEDIAAASGRIADLEAGGGAGSVTHNFQTGTTYTLVIGDIGKIVEMNNASSNTLTVPPNSSVAFAVGAWVTVRQYGAGLSTIAAGSGVTINSYGGGLKLAGRYAEATLTKRATNEWILSGETSV